MVGLRNELALGAEAAAFAAFDAGAKAFFGYPGTPSTEAFELPFVMTGAVYTLHRWYATPSAPRER